MEKNYESGNLIRVLRKMMLIMKLTTFLLLLFALHISASVNAQRSKLSFDMKGITIKEVLQIIESQTDYRFIYENEKINLDSRVNMQVNQESVENILEMLFRERDIQYSITESNLILINPTGSLPSKFMTQQSNTISGKVTDDSGMPLPGVTVVVKGTTTGTITGTDGYYSLGNVSINATLIFSFVGMKTQELAVSGKTNINVILFEETVGIEEVVAIGYGTVKKSDITGSVSSVKVDDLSQGVTANVDQMLIGKSAGVNVVQNSGEPGGGISINIRGASSINAGNSPLYVIDGVPIDNSRAIESASVTGFSSNRSPRNPLSSINASDIESIEILKDASATAIYGSRGANGVILITTKGGKNENMKVSYSGYVGVQNRANKLNLLSATDYKRIINEIIDEGGGSQSEKVQDIENGGMGTDWQDQLNNPNALVQDHQLSFSGGSEKSTYYASVNYMDQDGIMQNTSFKRYGARLNLTSKISDKFNIGMNVTGSYIQDSFIANGFGVNEGGGALYAAYNFDPTLSVKDDVGKYSISQFLTVDNPVAIAEGMGSVSNSERFLASAFGEYKILPELSVRVNIGSDFVNENRKSFVSSLTIDGRNNQGIAANQNVEKSNYLVEGTLNYSKSIKIHSFNALAGVTYQRFVTTRMANEASGFPNESLGADNLGIGDPTTFDISNSVSANRLASYIGRINYTLNDKYLATATIRADGSSRFGGNNKFGYFPSAALAWKMSSEPFIQKLSAINSMKLRASWGQTGNQEIGDYPALSTYSQAGTAIWGGVEVTGTQPARIPNPDLKWETTEQMNIGLDFGFLKNRINGSVDYYKKKTKDMLLNLPIPQSTGFSSILSNVGRIDNSGFELLINTVNISKNDFSWHSNVTFTTMKNEVKDLGGISQIIIGANYTHVTQVAIIKPGLPLNSYYGWEVNGIWQEGDDYSNFTEDYQPGDLKYVDQNGDKVVNDADRVVLGNSIPDFQWSFGNTFNYKNFELFVFWEGVQGVDMLNGNLIDNYFPINLRRNKFAEPYLNRWTPENPTNKYPSFTDPLKFGRRVINSQTLLDASYSRLKTVRLSYTLPKISSSIHSAQVYFTAENLWTITNYMGLDPAINPNNNQNFRMDFNAYPTARTIILGLKIDF